MFTASFILSGGGFQRHRAEQQQRILLTADADSNSQQLLSALLGDELRVTSYDSRRFLVISPECHIRGQGLDTFGTDRQQKHPVPSADFVQASGAVPVAGALWSQGLQAGKSALIHDSF